jgi:predicted transcriptional regulator
MKNLTNLERVVMAAVVEGEEYGGVVEDVIDELVKKEGMSENSVGGVLSSLVKKGVIDIEGFEIDGRILNQYMILDYVDFVPSI